MERIEKGRKIETNRKELVMDRVKRGERDAG